jgi:hypothetical protein
MLPIKNSILLYIQKVLIRAAALGGAYTILNELIIGKISNTTLCAIPLFFFFFYKNYNQQNNIVNL